MARRLFPLPRMLLAFVFHLVHALSNSKYLDIVENWDQVGVSTDQISAGYDKRYINGMDGSASTRGNVTATESPGPVIFNLGPGTTATHGIQKEFCKAKIRACHYFACCPVGLNHVPAHKALIISNINAQWCLDKRTTLGPLRKKLGSREWDCNAGRWKISFGRTVEDEIQALNNSTLDALSDTPLIGVIRRILDMLTPDRNVKFILTFRDPHEWAKRRLETHPYTPVCKFNTTALTGRLFNPMGDYLECVEAAKQALGSRESFHIRDVFQSMDSISQDGLAEMMRHYQEEYVYELVNRFFEKRGGKASTRCQLFTC